MVHRCANASATRPARRYYRILTSIENRFPISKDKGHAQVAFAWQDAFRPKTRVMQNNIHFEKAAVLFNLGAVLNQTALQCDRTTPEGLQQACKLFQVRRCTYHYGSGARPCLFIAEAPDARWRMPSSLPDPCAEQYAAFCAALSTLQEAAGAFAYLLEAEASKVDSPRPLDLIPEAITSMEKLMLAQVRQIGHNGRIAPSTTR